LPGEAYHQSVLALKEVINPLAQVGKLGRSPFGEKKDGSPYVQECKVLLQRCFAPC